MIRDVMACKLEYMQEIPASYEPPNQPQKYMNMNMNMNTNMNMNKIIND